MRSPDQHAAALRPAGLDTAAQFRVLSEPGWRGHDHRPGRAGRIPDDARELVPQTNPISRMVDITIDPDVKLLDASTATLPGQARDGERRRLRLAADPVGSHDRPRQSAWRSGDHRVSDRSRSRCPRGDRARGWRRQVVTDQDLPLPPKGPGPRGHHRRRPRTQGNAAVGAISRFDGAGLEELDVTNQRATTGGTDRQAKVVTEDDRKALEDKLRKQAHDRGFTMLQQRAGTSRPCPNRPSASIQRST